MFISILAAIASIAYVSAGFVFWDKVIVAASTRDALEGCGESADFMAANAVDHPINLAAKLAVIIIWPALLAAGLCTYALSRLQEAMEERHG